MSFSSSNNPIQSRGLYAQMVSFNATLKVAEGAAQLGSHQVDTGGMQKTVQPTTDYARAASLQAFLADMPDFHPSLFSKSIMRRTSALQRKLRAGGKFTREMAAEQMESEPEESVEQDNRKQGQTTVQIAKKIIKHMKDHGAL